MKRINDLYLKMIDFYKGDPLRTQHFVKVHSFAKLIAQQEGMEAEQRYILEAAALVHDIGIRISMDKYGRSDGKLQEQEGPAAARSMMQELGFEQGVIERVAYLVGHHHTYSAIDGLDYQILVEADFLVNYFEDNLDRENIRKSVNKIFRTQTGRTIAERMFFPEKDPLSETWAQDSLQDLEDFIEEQGIYIRQ